MKLRIASIVLPLIIASTSIYSNENTVRTVNNARWQIQEQINPETILEQNASQNLVSIYFVRPLDNDDIQSSANLAVNNRYQVSLQPGNFTQVYSCAGTNHLSAVTTNQKTNDLLRNALTVTLNAGTDYFYLVDVEANNTTLTPIEKAQAIELMDDHTYQEHQISRVLPTCIPQSIELKVLFDNDKYYVHPQYYPEIEQVAEFMANAANMTVTIEGHTDSNASDAHNQRLSENRANAIKNILIQEFGVDSNKLHAIGYGESRPIASNATAEGRQQNRRVIAVFNEH